MNAVNQQERLLITEELKWFLAGVIEGEGSLCVSIKNHKASKYGFVIDPEFFLYQHKCGIKLLHLAESVFGCAIIRSKPGNKNVLVFSITDRQSLINKVIPFFEKYMEFSSKWISFEKFRQIVLSMEKKEHFYADGLIKLLKKAYEMNPFSKGKERKRTLEDVIKRILRGHTPESTYK